MVLLANEHDPPRAPQFCSTILQSITVLLALVSFVWAVPFAQFEADLPRDVSCIAHDEISGHFLTFFSDGSLYRKFSVVETERQWSEGLYARRTNGSSCTNLSVDQLKNRQRYYFCLCELIITDRQHFSHWICSTR
jgi:hypothetical protein